MRPDPEDLRTESPDARIIHLGDVRRRRGARRRQQPDGHYLAALALVALVSWAAWFTVVLSLQPARLLSYAAFLLPLAFAIGSTAAIGFYSLDWRRGRVPSFRTELRRGALLAGVVVANLGFLAAHRWSVVVFGAAVLLAVALEGFTARST